MAQPAKITVQSIVIAPIEKVWRYWTKPEHIVHWAFASDDWEAPAAENGPRVGKVQDYHGRQKQEHEF